MAVKKQPLYFNRELSWLEFNQRVLEEAKSPANPMLERLKFLAITASNLDEFFMVRVGGLHMARKAGQRKKDPSGLTPLAQLREVTSRAKMMMNELHRCFNDSVAPALKQGGIEHADISHLSTMQEGALFDLFTEELFPIITPIAVKHEKMFPKQGNLATQVLIRLEAN